MDISNRNQNGEKNMRIRLVIGSFIALVAVAPSLGATPLGTAFIYQGQLKENGAPMDGTTHLRFSLWDAAGVGSPPVGGSQIGASHLLANVPVANGLFTVPLNAGGQFGANAFNGEARWIQIEVCADAGCGTLTVLSPRQPLTAAPYARTAAGLALPYSASVSATSDAVNITQTGTGDAAQFNIVNPANVGEAVEARTDGSGDAVQAVNTGTGRAGYFQISNAANVADAIYATTNGTGSALFGLATAATGSAYGVYGQTQSTNGRGVVGWARAANGTIYGVYGLASTVAAGYAVWAQGDMGASGVKPFRIDHPDDPANKYLLHYAAESPEVINFYRGTVVLDGMGEAVVELPHYFAKINKTPSYQLTAVGAPMPMLHVAGEIDEAALSAGATAGAGVAAPICSFRIAGGAPGAKVSWEIKAVRNDLWVQNRAVAVEALRDGVSIQTRAMPVEVEKQGAEKGTYQHPELYGLSAEMSMDYDAERERPSPASAERGLHDRPDSERPTPRTLPHAMPH